MIYIIKILKINIEIQSFDIKHNGDLKRARALPIRVIMLHDNFPFLFRCIADAQDRTQQ